MNVLNHFKPNKKYLQETLAFTGIEYVLSETQVFFYGCMQHHFSDNAVSE